MKAFLIISYPYSNNHKCRVKACQGMRCKNIMWIFLSSFVYVKMRCMSKE